MRKLQVFISSTYLDMLDERQAAVEATLQAGHIPAGMELFTAGDESQLDTILRWIDESDILLLLLGERYGSLDPKSGKSYIQVEYEHALERGKRVFALVLSDRWIDAKYKSLGQAASDTYRKEHAEFKSLVMSKICRIVDDPKDVRIEITRTLNNYANDDSLTGWVRASEYSRMQGLLSELQVTVSELRKRPHSEAPTLLELSNEFGVRTEELRSIPLDFSFEYAFNDRPGVRRYQLNGSGLSLVWWERRNLKEGNVSDRDQFPGTRYFIRRLGPVLEVWGFATKHGGYLYLTPKGQLFIDFLNENPIGEQDYIRFDELPPLVPESSTPDSNNDPE